MPTEPAPTTPNPATRRPRIRTGLAILAVAVVGAMLGFLGGLLTPAHLQIAGAEAAVRLHPGHDYDELSLGGSVLTGRRASDRRVLGEPLGVSVQLNLDASTFVSRDGTFDANVLPAYVQTFSDPAQLARDLRWALVKHLLLSTLAGVALSLIAVALMLERRRRRRAQLSRLDDDAAQAIQAEWSRQSTVRSRIAVAVAIVVALAVLPSGASHPPRRAPITPNPILADTPLAGTEVGGLLRPALAVLDSYIKTYFADSDKYYDRLRSAVLAYLDANPVQLPNDPNVANVLFVTDRHCNIGMDRVIVALAKRFGIKVLVSGGDDDFSGSFAFESACTANLASKSQEAGLTDVFVAGNHDSAQTLEDERDQHIHTLEDKPVTVDGITYVGLPDPRSSRYGQGIQPASPEAQHTLLIAQGEGIGELACGTSPPVVIVAHDPLAGTTALHSSCGKPLLALDGHTHKQAGPTAVSLPEQDETAHQFVGGSTGGAPGEGALDKTLVSRLTVGPLHHHASINVVSIDRRTGALVGVTVCHMTPSQDVTFEQLTVP